MLAVWHFVFETTNFDFTILQLLFHLFSQMSTYGCDKRGARYRKIWKMAVLHPIVHWNVFPDWRKHLGKEENGFLTSSLCVSYKWGFHLESLERQRQRQMCVVKLHLELIGSASPAAPNPREAKISLLHCIDVRLLLYLARKTCLCKLIGLSWLLFAYDQVSANSVKTDWC